MKKFFSYIFLGLCAGAMASCSSDDEFTESIYDTNIPVYDENSATYPFDKWVYENFTEPYNVQIQYKFNFNASDKDFQLSPAEYNRSQLLSHFVRHLFYDVYTDCRPADEQNKENFMKKYGPRLFHFIGSSGYSPSTGTEVLGTASGGVKITLYNVNEMKPYSDDVVYTAADIDLLNDRYFHTMHHEFSHILHQTKSYPVTFGQVTSGSYDSSNWQDRDSTTTHRLGYVTHYASSANTEDFVEVLSCIITDTEWRWMHRIISATVNGMCTGDKEQIKEFIKSLDIKDVDNPDAHWNNFAVYTESEYDNETGQYVPTDNKVLDIYRSTATVANKDYNAEVPQYRYTLYKRYNSFSSFLDDVTVSSQSDNMGINAILKKISIATTWYKENWQFDIYRIRRELSKRQETINDYIHDKSRVVIYDYQ
ncbi:MAG: putative zinc-binding metallopeptidase [Bacteroidales bacterium]|nr:putative zinc-binding metallopeptidase [Bacteroidales bacterium]MCM1146299.1 putative zinc-binding metallopeptidase [Bacteroidales bacterium]MCM1205263.1 putative zinc-binding metallopeptidase [Bacillota bacterium]MCM1509652.1 putative zinc-binding metallopeptidase [Clostridium sp.]